MGNTKMNGMARLAKAWMLTAVWAAMAALAVGCGDDAAGGGGAGGSVAPRIAENGRLQIQVIAPSERGDLLTMAVDDLRSALVTITGASANSSAAKPYAVATVVDATQMEKLGHEGYLLQSGVVPDGRPGVTITAATQTGAAYGIYQVIYDMGLLYYHPEARYTPDVEGRRLPWNYPNEVSKPRFGLRGFHEHTQHPIPMSDYYLRPDPEHREAVSRYLKWLARNRQNTAFFHMLKTVDLDAWLPYIEDIAAEANSYGIGLGLVTSFVDQQQNHFKLIDEQDPESAELQIRKRLNQLLGAGFSYIAFQIGSTEFTKPADSDVINWLNTATSHIRNQWAAVEAFAWIHITCDLEADDGGQFFHLPLQADTDLSAMVHTTMFYTVDSPAPVYGCESFEHQKAFMEAANETRRQVWFPETAWWLGFDNNAPVILPITGWARHYDVTEGISEYDVTGHITFTTGREWTYWQYDHYVAQMTWDDRLTWSQYVDKLKDLWGGQGSAMAAALKTWTDLQRADFFGENPRIYFYLAGELPQDEIGAQAGVYARPPKIAYSEVYGYGAADFTEWKTRDFDMLARMRDAYGAAIEDLPQELTDGTAQQRALYREMRIAFEVTYQRIRHAIALYGAVISARSGDKPEALARLGEAQTITVGVKALLVEMEKYYRSPLDILAREKPDSLTSYPFGYLADTSTGYFWERRDEQLGAFLDQIFNAIPEKWSAAPDAVYVAGAGAVTLTEPDDPIAGPVIAAFVPRFLFGIKATGGEDVFALQVAEDSNENNKPDPETEQDFQGAIDGAMWVSAEQQFSVLLRDNTGNLIGTLLIDPANISVAVAAAAAEGDPLPTLEGVEVAGMIASEQLVGAIMAVGGIDEEGASNLVKSVYGVDKAEPLPDSLPLKFSITLEPLAD